MQKLLFVTFANFCYINLCTSSVKYVDRIFFPQDMPPVWNVTNKPPEIINDNDSYWNNLAQAPINNNGHQPPTTSRPPGQIIVVPRPTSSPPHPINGPPFSINGPPHSINGPPYPIDGPSYPHDSELQPLPVNRPTPSPIVTSASSYERVLEVTAALDKELSKTSHGSVVLFSPVSIFEVLSLLLLGASGATKKEIANLLGFKNENEIHHEFGNALKLLEKSNDKKNNLIIHTASGLFVQTDVPINEQYKQSVHQIYDSEIYSVDFFRNLNQAMNTVNSWVNQKTYGEIPTLDLKPSPNMIMIIVSTLYFHGDWERPFNADLTHKRIFFPNGFGNPAQQVMVDMMGAVDDYYYYKDPILNCTIVGLPYKGDTTVFYAIQPFDSSITKLKQLKRNLTPEHLDRLISHLKLRSITLLLPKISLTRSIVLNDVLQNLNVSSVFDSDKSDLSLILANFKNGQRGLHVDDIVHQVKIEITEKGTTAAAATSASVARTLNLIVKLDTPFMFFIRNIPSKLDLIWGTIETPKPNFPV